MCNSIGPAQESEPKASVLGSLDDCNELQLGVIFVVVWSLVIAIILGILVAYSVCV